MADTAATEPTTSSLLRFARLARDLSNTARDLGMTVPGFRSPPPGRSVRSVRRNNDGSFDVSVLIRARPWEAVAVDMIDGILHVNGAGHGSSHPQRQTWRDALYAAADDLPLRADASETGED